VRGTQREGMRESGTERDEENGRKSRRETEREV
jgi:hypothetical protein